MTGMTYPGRRAEQLLRRDGHPAGAGRLRWDDQRWHQFNTHPITRSAEQINEQITAAEQGAPDGSISVFSRAIAAAMRWAIGEGGPGPITGEPIVGAAPTWVEIAVEIDAAEDVIYRERDDRRPRSWMVGVEHALMWTIGDTDQAPMY